MLKKWKIVKHYQFTEMVSYCKEKFYEKIGIFEIWSDSQGLYDYIRKVFKTYSSNKYSISIYYYPSLSNGNNHIFLLHHKIK